MTDRGLRIAVGGLALAGAAIAGYLTHAHLTGTSVACGTGGCETVQSSAYGEVLGLPVAVLGLAAYLALLGTALAANDLAPLIGAALALVGVAFGAYLLAVQLVVLEALCPWCVASDAVMALLAAAAVGRIAPDQVAALRPRALRAAAGHASAR